MIHGGHNRPEVTWRNFFSGGVRNGLRASFGVPPGNNSCCGAILKRNSGLRLAWCLKPKVCQFGGEEEAEWVIHPESDYHHPLLPREEAGGEDVVSSPQEYVYSP